MKKFANILLAIVPIVSMIVIYACSKNAEPGKIVDDTAYKPLDWKEIEIGKMHNDVVLRIYASYHRYLKSARNNSLSDVPPADQREIERVRVIREICINELRATPFDATPIGLTNEQFYSVAIETMDELAANGFDIRNIPTPSCNPVVMGYVNEILAGADKLNTLQEMNTAFDAVYAKANANLAPGKDLDEVKGIVQIAKGSAALWAGMELLRQLI